MNNNLMSIRRAGFLCLACLVLATDFSVCGSMVRLTGVHIEVYVSDPSKTPPTVIAQGWTEANAAVELSSAGGGPF